MITTRVEGSKMDERWKAGYQESEDDENDDDDDDLKQSLHFPPSEVSGNLCPICKNSQSELCAFTSIVCQSFPTPSEVPKTCQSFSPGTHNSGITSEWETT